MSGRSSRNKGRRGEYLVRDYLRNLGLEAVRVPLSGASQGYKGDVAFKYADKTHTVEVKFRKQSFVRQYTFLTETADLTGTCWFKEGETYVGMSFHLLNLMKPSAGTVYSNKQGPAVYTPTLREYKKDCDFLALKANGKPFIFMVAL